MRQMLPEQAPQADETMTLQDGVSTPRGRPEKRRPDKEPAVADQTKAHQIKADQIIRRGDLHLYF